MKIGVYGSAGGPIGRSVDEKAREVGREIARRGHILVTGGCLGIPYEAVLGAYELGGECIGFSPATDMDCHVNVYELPTDGFSEFVFIPEDYVHVNERVVCLKYRNVSSVAAVDAAVIIGGRIGSMNEFTIAFDLGKSIGVLEGSGGISDRAIKVLLEDANKPSSSKIIFDSDPASLVEQLCSL